MSTKSLGPERGAAFAAGVSMRNSTLRTCLCLALATSSFGCATEVDPELGTETSAVTTRVPSSIPSLRQATTEAGADALARDLSDELQTNLRDDRLRVHIYAHSPVATRDRSGETYSMMTMILIFRGNEQVGETCYGRLVENVEPRGRRQGFGIRLFCTDGPEDPHINPYIHADVQALFRVRNGFYSFEYPFMAFEKIEDEEQARSNSSSAKR